jgi:hypothetical protein
LEDVIDNTYVLFMYIFIPAGPDDCRTHLIICQEDYIMPSLTRNTSSALGQLLGAVGAIGSVATKSMLMLDRLTDAGYSHADTFAMNTELRNQGSVKDAVLDEEVRDLERTIERLRHEEHLHEFYKAHPNLKPATDKPSKAKPSKSHPKAKAAGTG